MTDTKRKIQELNVLEKLLEQDLISVKKSLGDEEVVKAVNDKIKGFLSKYLDSIFSGTSQSDSPFSPEAATVLNEFANRLLAKARAEGSLPLRASETPQAPPPAAPPEEPIEEGDVHTAAFSRKSVRHQGSPVLDALKNTGFDPNAPVEERVKAIKNAARKEKK